MVPEARGYKWSLGLQEPDPRKSSFGIGGVGRAHARAFLVFREETVSTDTSMHGYEKLGVFQEPRMRRDVNWLQVVFIAAGSPALVMFNLGGLAAITRTISPLIWAISVILGFLELFVYAEIAGLHPSKSGGTAVHGATAWVRYSKIVAPISIFSNWLAWSPILAIGSGLASG